MPEHGSIKKSEGQKRNIQDIIQKYVNQKQFIQKYVVQKKIKFQKAECGKRISDRDHSSDHSCRVHDLDDQ